MHSITPIMIYSKIDAQCDQVVAAVNRTKSITPVTVMYCNISKFIVWHQDAEGRNPLLEILVFPSKIMQDKPRVATIPKNENIGFGSQTDRHSIYHASPAFFHFIFPFNL